MNYPLTTSGQVHAAASLAEAVADRYGCVGVISRAALGTAALLDQTERELSLRHIRCVRVQGTASGGLASRGLIAQIVARPDPNALTDADLKAGFIALTEPGEGFRRVALLVAEAHSLRPSALRYVQLARQATPAKLCVVLAGQPGLVAALADEEFAPLRSAMHMMALSEMEGPGLFDRASAVPEPPAARPGGGSPLARLGLAACIIPLVGLIWWRHLPALPAAPVPSQDVPSASASIGTPSVPDVAGTPSVPSAAEPPVAAPAALPPAAVPVEHSGEPAPPGPDPVAPRQAEADLHAAGPAPPVAAATVPEPPASETPPASEIPAEPEAPAESSADAAPPPAATEQPATEPSAAVVAEPPAIAAEPPAAAAELPAAPPERSEGPTGETVADPPAPRHAVPDDSPPMPEPAIAAKPPAPPPPHGTLTVTAALPAHGGARRATAPVAVPQAAAPPIRPAEDRPNPADERRCRDIVLRAQLGKDPSDADKQFLRSGCRSG